MTSPAKFIDHTLLKATTTAGDIRLLCEEAVEYGFASVCVPPLYVPLATSLLYGSTTAVGTVVAFPFGYTSTANKLHEMESALHDGARELDVVIPIGQALAGEFAAIDQELLALVQASHSATVKIILECCYLDEACKLRLVESVVQSGAAYVKTSTGYGSGGATLADVRLLHATAAGRIKVKAAGGLRDWPSCRALLQAGAARLGTSAGVTIMQQWLAETLYD